jgi:hypothetical protein
MIGQKDMMSADKDDIDNDDYMIRQAGIHQNFLQTSYDHYWSMGALSQKQQ